MQAPPNEPRPRSVRPGADRRPAPAWAIGLLLLSMPVVGGGDVLAQSDGARTPPSAGTNRAANPVESLSSTFGRPRLMTTESERRVLERYRERLAERGPAPEAETSGGTDLTLDLPEEPPEAVEAAPTPAQPLFLGALIYLDAKTWTLWLNGERISPETPNPDLSVLAVSPRQVTLRWQARAAADARTFTLAPRQSYLPDQDKVIDGRPPPPEPAGDGQGEASPAGETTGQGRNSAQ